MVGPEVLVIHLDPKAPPHERQQIAEAIWAMKTITRVYPIKHGDAIARLMYILNKPAQELDLMGLDAWIEEREKGNK